MNAKELGQQSVSAYSRMRDDIDTIGGALHGMKFDRCDGLTKRELFAAMAMQALIAKAPIEYVDGQTEQTRSVAGGATDYADALLAELAKDQP